MKKNKGFSNNPSKKSAEVAFNRGISCFQQQDLASAQTAFKEAIALDPNSPQAYIYLALVSQQLSSLSLSEITQLFRQAIKLKPDYLEAYFNLGIVLGKQGLLTESNEAYLKVIEIQPDCLQAYYNLGVNYTKQSNFIQAQECFKKAIAIKPDYPEAYYNLGISQKQQGLLEEATQTLRQAIALKPDYSQAYNNLGTIFQQQGLLEEATTLYQSAITHQNTYLPAYHNLALILCEQDLFQDAETFINLSLQIVPNPISFNIKALIYTKIFRFQQAETACYEAIKLQPDYAEAYNNLGFILAEQERHTEAIKAYSKAIELQPEYTEAYNNLAVSLKSEKKYTEAIAACLEAIKLNPNYAQAYNNLGVSYKEMGLLEEATQAYNKAIQIKTDYAEVYNNLGIALGEKGLNAEAAKACKQAIALKPGYGEAYCNLGVILAEEWELKEAITAFRQAITIKPDQAKAHYNLGSILLLSGEFQEGWKEYEWRWEGCNTPYPEFPQPVWDGSSLGGKTILLVSEQGLGDSLQFIRYATLVSELGAKVKIACPSLLVELFESVKGVSEVIAINDASNTEFDVYLPLLSLPHRLGTTLETIPNQVPYLSCDKSVDLITPVETTLKIGIVWKSGYRSQDLGLYNTYKKKSCDVALFLQLLDIPGVTLYSLQVGKDAAEIDPYLPHPRIVNLSSVIKDFTDTAAIVNQLDLVISVDTSVAHLAGALNKPVWVLLPYFCDWRWLQQRSDTPWYPTMRLFRQTQRDDWKTIFNQIIQALQPKIGETDKMKSKHPTSNTPHPTPQILCEAAKQYRLQGNLSLCVEMLQNAIALQPNNPEYYYELGMTFNKQGLFPEAAAAYTRVIALKSDVPEAYHNLGVVLTKQGLYPEADKAYRQAIALKPDWAEAYYNLGITLTARDLQEEAKEVYKSAIAIKPDFPKPYNNLGSILSKQGFYEEALSVLKQAIHYQSDYLEAYSNIGYIYHHQRLFTQAENIYQHCINLKPDFPDNYFHLGVVYQDQQLLIPAEMAYRRAISLQPDYAAAHYNLSSVLILQGNLIEGLAEYEWRWRSHHLPLPEITQPPWDGSNPSGKTLLIVAEQGLGDILQFIRYAPILAQQGATVKLACPMGLVRLLANVEGIQEVIPITAKLNCECDYYVPIMSLPHLLKTTLDTIPAQIPYIKVNSALAKPENLICHPECNEGSHQIDDFKENLCKTFNVPQPSLPETKHLKIGIVWASGMRTTDPGLFGLYQEKSTSVELFTQLLELPNLNLYSLQVGKDAQQIEAYKNNSRIVDLSPLIKDFHDTACLVKQLDLVISVDTSVAHLVGAMGKPVWVLLPYSPDWRWFLGRSDSPWYPTMRLFRQSTPGDWASVFSDIKENLKILLV